MSVRRPAALVAALLALAVPRAVPAETVIAVNGGAGVYDQPSVAMRGSVAHVAYIGAPAPGDPFKVFYAAVNGAAGFSNLSLTRAAALVTLPTAVDNAAAPSVSYADARHPRIAVRSAGEVIVFFQAKPSSPSDPDYVLYRARLVLDNNAVVFQDVRPVGGLEAGDARDVALALVAADNTARIAYAHRAPASSGPYAVRYARVAVDNAEAAGPSLLLSSGDGDTATGSDGDAPLPALRVDAKGRTHVAWAAGNSAATAAAVYYALVKTASGLDNVGIGATEVLGRTMRWIYPSLAVPATNVVHLFAGDGAAPASAGPLGYARLNPDAVAHTGGPVAAGSIRAFLVQGPTVLPASFDLYRPEIVIDSSGRFHATGYGAQGSSATYYAIAPVGSYPYMEFKALPLPVGLNEYPGEIDGDYTKAAVGYTSGRAVVFWSGAAAGTGLRDLDVTALPTVTEAVTSQETGCSAARSPAGATAARIAGALLLLLPAFLLALRRLLVRVRGREAG